MLNKFIAEVEECVNKNWELTIQPREMKLLLPELKALPERYSLNFRILQAVCTMLKYHYPYALIRLLIQDMVINHVRVNFGDATVSDGEMPNIIRINFSLSVAQGCTLNNLMEEIEQISPDESIVDELAYNMVKYINNMLVEGE